MYSRVHVDDHPTKKVDVMVEDVENDISKLLKRDELELKNLYGNYSGDPGILTSRSDRSTKSSKPLVVFHKIRVFNDEFDHDEPEGESSNLEDVKFSHEISNENKALVEMRSKYEDATSELDKMKFKYNKAKEHLKKFDNRVQELEVKVETKEEENARLQEEVKKASRSTINMARLANQNPTAGNTASNQQVADMNKRAEEIRKALLSDENEEVQVSFDDLFRSKNVLHVIYQWLKLKMTPFKRDITQIQAKFGSSIASYFIFVRFVFLHMLIIGVVMFVFSIVHLSYMWGRPEYANNKANIIVNHSGYLPMFMRYVTFNSSEGVLYSAMVCFVLTFILVILCTKIVSEDRFIKDVSVVVEDNSSPYSKEILCAWDFTINTKMEVDDQCGSMGNKVLQQLDATHTQGLKKQRTKAQTVALYARRILGFYMYLYLLAVSSAAILYLTINSETISHQAKGNRFLRNIASLISPFMLTAINSIVPMLLKYINAVEKWDTVQTELNVALFRSYVSNTLNSGILALSYLLLADPFLLAATPTLRNGIQLQTNPNYPCRLDQASDGLFTLMVFTWALNLVSMYATPLGMKFFTEYIRRKVWIKDEFDIADQMVKLLNFLGLIFMAFPFAPLSMIFVPFFLGINFKFEKYCVKHWYARPKRIARGQSIGLVFTLFYLSTFVLLGCTIGFYFLTTKTFAKSCSIQDEHAELCNGAVSGDVCTMDQGSLYYTYFKATYGVNGYPDQLCNDACGPFVDDSSNFNPIKDRMLGVSAVFIVWEILFVYPYLSWFLVIVLAIVVAVKVNSMEVMTYASYSKEKEMEAHISMIEAERKRQEKTIKKLKQLSAAEEHKVE